jgi:hypothetical protein
VVRRASLSTYDFAVLASPDSTRFGRLQIYRGRGAAELMAILDLGPLEGFADGEPNCAADGIEEPGAKVMGVGPAES